MVSDNLMDDLGPPPDLMVGMPDPNLIPDTGHIARLRVMARELADVDSQIETLTAALKKLADRKQELAQTKLPEIFDLCMTDRIGVPDFGVDVEVAPLYHANIRADWEEEQREAGFEALEQIGGESLVRIVMTVEFERGEWELAQATADRLRVWNEFGNREIRLAKSVPWNTLTAFVKGLVQGGKVMPPGTLDKLGAHVGRVAKIVKRKGKK